MKRRTTYTLIATTLLLALSMQGCMKDITLSARESGSEPIQKDIPMNFRFEAENMEEARSGTRGSTTELDDIKQVWMYGYYTSDERWEWSADRWLADNTVKLQPNYYANERFDRSGTAGDYEWLSTLAPRYWPPDTRYKVSYFAYHYPPNAGSYVVPSTTVVPNITSATQSGVPTVTYTVPNLSYTYDGATRYAGIDRQIDLLRGACIDMTKNGADEIAGTADDGIVPMTMQHALTQVKFTLRFDDPEEAALYQYVSVEELVLSGIYDKGTMRLDNGEWSFDEATQRMSLTIRPSYGLSSVCNMGIGTTTYDTTTYELLDLDTFGAMMLIPQSLKNVTLTLKLTFADANPLKGNITVPAIYELAETEYEWLPGRSVNYCILLRGEFIAIHTTLTPWTEYTTNVNIIGI